ncbi:MAG TPA: hypothetical protein VFV64_14890 [Permianibacter sp.]|nr:hypothetical protein [Permianibacter sp.]
MKKKDKGHKHAHGEHSRKQKLQQQLLQVRRRRKVTAVFGVLVLLGLVALEYFRSVPLWLWITLWVIPFLLVLDTVYLKHLRQQLHKSG